MRNFGGTRRKMSLIISTATFYSIVYWAFLTFSVAYFFISIISTFCFLALLLMGPINNRAVAIYPLARTISKNNLTEQGTAKLRSFNLRPRQYSLLRRSAHLRYQDLKLIWRFPPQWLSFVFIYLYFFILIFFSLVRLEGPAVLFASALAAAAALVAPLIKTLLGKKYPRLAVKGVIVRRTVNSRFRCAASAYLRARVWSHHDHLLVSRVFHIDSRRTKFWHWSTKQTNITTS